MEEYIMIYEIKTNTNYIRILGAEFVSNNKNKGRIIYNNKIYPLQETFQTEDINKINNKLKIKMLLSVNCVNKSCLFKDCSTLLIIKFNNNIYNQNFESDEKNDSEATINILSNNIINGNFKLY